MAGFVHVSDKELDVALTYAYKKYGVRLDKALLRALANQTGERIVRTGEQHYIAKQHVLALFLPQKNKSESARRNAYSAAVGKMASERSKFQRTLREKQAQPHPEPTAVQTARIPLLLEPSGQYSWILNSH